MSLINNEYHNWLIELKSKIRSVQAKASVAVNSALIEFYWDLGKMLNEVSKSASWGSNWIQYLSKDLRLEFPEMEGFSKTNLYNIKRFNLFYKNDEFFHQLGGKIPWRHHVEIFTKSKTINEAYFYINETISKINLN